MRLGGCSTDKRPKTSNPSGQKQHGVLTKRPPLTLPLPFTFFPFTSPPHPFRFTSSSFCLFAACWCSLAKQRASRGASKGGIVPSEISPTAPPPQSAPHAHTQRVLCDSEEGAPEVRGARSGDSVVEQTDGVGGWNGPLAVMERRSRLSFALNARSIVVCFVRL